MSVSQIQSGHALKQCQMATEPMQRLVCDQHKQTFDYRQLNLLSRLLPPECTKVYETLAKQINDASTSPPPDERFMNVFADWIIHGNSDAFLEITETDDLDSDGFFAI